MTGLIDTTDMRLGTMLERGEEHIVPLRARISERLGHSGPTVSQTVGRMERDGLVVVSEDRTLELTDAGRRKAVDVMRKHRLAERLLSDVIGLDWAFVHEEACRWEHVMSEQVERRRAELRGHPTAPPSGNPIRGRGQLGAAPARTFDERVRGLVKNLSAAGEPIDGTVRRLAEPARVDRELLQQLRDAG